MIVVIALYNLSLQSSGLGCHGHFHFSSHITSFVDKNWRKFFPNAPKRKRKNLLGTIASVLSQHSPEAFTSGTDEVGSIGWWKLSKKWTPEEYEKFYQNKGKRNVNTDGDDEELTDLTDIKRARLIDEDKIKLENCFLDTEDGLLNELNQLKDELSAACSVKVEATDEETPRSDLELVSDSMKINDMVSLSGEEKTYRKLKNILETEQVHKSEIPPWIRNYYNKLNATRAKRKAETNDDGSLKSIVEKDSKVLDKYCTSVSHHLHSLLSGPTSYDLFHSPYTNQVLHPFIYRDKKIFPRWLKLMCELKHDLDGEPPERSSIDFCYVKPQHIPAVNSLLQRTFWPGIDMSDSLSCPDFSIVALYKKLVVGCAFLVPDACHNEAYISFLAVRHDWDRCGIGSFMLYHLTQTSHGKDITLHVSASNSAVCLYQKFGFKTEELVLDFYEKFLPVDSPHSPHALLLRLTR